MLFAILFCLTFSTFSSVLSSNLVNDRPIIGVVTEEVLNSKIAPNASAQMYASYVKFLESAGARVVPIWIRKTPKYYSDLLGKINGVLFPGGAVYLTESGYGRTGKIIFDIATKLNDKGDYFPLWGTCLGFELMNFAVAKKSWMTSCAAEDMAANLQFVKGFDKSRMFQELEPKLENIMKKEAVNIHYHIWCLTPHNYSVSGLDKYFKVLALNQDSRNLTFISIIEAFKYPFYGVAFHPEKVVFEWPLSKTHSNIPHSLEATKVSQYFGNFFVNEARKSNHHYPTKAMEDAALIYNYNPIYTGKINNNPAMQRYFF